ncbi:MAG: mitochondrial fission ELM1 family protein [Proteobacteria bacterium]|nr:mitochondrial fission ELM1 family protein [Pseudomonadota bacterium]
MSVVWALVDDRAGHRSQCLGVAEALGAGFDVKRLDYRVRAELPNVLLGATFGGLTSASRGDLGPPWPDLVIAPGRRTGPVGRMTYVAGVASPNPHAGISRWAHEPGVVTVTIGEMDLGASRPALRIVQHLRWAAEQGDRMDAEIHRTLLGLWRCRRVVVGAPENGPTPAHPPVMPNPPPGVVVTPMGRAARSRMGIGLLETIAARRVKAYVDDGSPESREFWAQIVKAQSRVSRDGTLDFDVDASPGGDGLLLSLALAVEAAHELFQPTQGRLHESIPA